TAYCLLPTAYFLFALLPCGDCTGGAAGCSAPAGGMSSSPGRPCGETIGGAGGASTLKSSATVTCWRAAISSINLSRFSFSTAAFACSRGDCGAPNGLPCALG